MGEAFTGSASRDDLLALAGAIVLPTKWGLYDRDALETWVQGRICLLGDAAHPMLPTFGQGAAQSFEDAAALASSLALHGRDVAKAMLHYERVRHYRATRFQLGSKFAFDHLRAKDTAAQKALLETLDERVSPAFAHDKRGGEDNSWIYAYDARKIGAELPTKRLGPWDFRRAAKADYAAITASSGCQLFPPRVYAPSRAKRSPCTTPETTAGSSSREKSTTSLSGHLITLVALESPECTAARKPLPNSVTTTVPRLGGDAAARATSQRAKRVTKARLRLSTGMQLGRNRGETFSQPTMSRIGVMTRMPIERLMDIGQAQWRLEDANLGCAGKAPSGSFKNKADHLGAFKKKGTSRKLSTVTSIRRRTPNWPTC